MSISSLANTVVKILSPIDSQDIYAGHTDQFYTKYAEFRCRVRLLKPKLESFINGKESSYPEHRFYLPSQLAITEGDLIYDVIHDRYYDIVMVDFMSAENWFMTVDAKEIYDYLPSLVQLSSSSSSTEWMSSSSSSTEERSTSSYSSMSSNSTSSSESE